MAQRFPSASPTGRLLRPAPPQAQGRPGATFHRWMEPRALLPLAGQEPSGSARLLLVALFCGRAASQPKGQLGTPSARVLEQVLGSAAPHKATPVTVTPNLGYTNWKNAALSPPPSQEIQSLLYPGHLPGSESPKCSLCSWAKAWAQGTPFWLNIERGAVRPKHVGQSEVLGSGWPHTEWTPAPHSRPRAPLGL